MWCPCKRSRSEVKVKVKSIPRIMHLGNLVIAIHGILFIMCLIICNTNYIDISCCTFLITFEVLIGEANVQLDINHLAKFVFHLEKLQSKYIKCTKRTYSHTRGISLHMLKQKGHPVDDSVILSLSALHHVLYLVSSWYDTTDYVRAVIHVMATLVQVMAWYLKAPNQHPNYCSPKAMSSWWIFHLNNEIIVLKYDKDSL